MLQMSSKEENFHYSTLVSTLKRQALPGKKLNNNLTKKCKKLREIGLIGVNLHGTVTKIVKL